MVLKDMYKGLVNSPETRITEEITDVATTITVESIEPIPEAPNLLTLGGDTDNPETVKLIERSGSTLTVERGFQGTAKAWPVFTTISRNFTEYDHNAFIDNINEVQTGINDVATELADLLGGQGKDYFATKVSVDDLGGEVDSLGNQLDDLSGEGRTNETVKGVADELSSHKADMATQSNLGHVKLPENWITAVLQNGFAEYLGGVQYKKDEFGIVSVRIGIVSPASSSSAITTLPVGYRPTTRVVGYLYNHAAGNASASKPVVLGVDGILANNNNDLVEDYSYSGVILFRV